MNISAYPSEDKPDELDNKKNYADGIRTLRLIGGHIKEIEDIEEEEDEEEESRG